MKKRVIWASCLLGTLLSSAVASAKPPVVSVKLTAYKPVVSEERHGCSIGIDYYVPLDTGFALDLGQLRVKLRIRRLPSEGSDSAPFRPELEPRYTGDIDPCGDRHVYREHRVLQFPGPGVYEVSCRRPKTDTEEVRFCFNTAHFAIVSGERLKELKTIRDSNPELALLSYQFRYPHSEAPAGPMTILNRLQPLRSLLKEVKLEGMQLDELFFWLGAPDKGSAKPHLWWALGPDFLVEFSNDLVVTKAMICSDVSGEDYFARKRKEEEEQAKEKEAE